MLHSEECYKNGYDALISLHITENIYYLESSTAAAVARVFIKMKNPENSFEKACIFLVVYRSKHTLTLMRPDSSKREGPDH